MSDQAPSKPLLGLLAVSALAAGWVYGRPLLAGEDEAAEEQVVVPADLGFVEEETVPEGVPWQLPAEPRNPFLRIELGVPAAPEAPGEGDGESTTG